MEVNTNKTETLIISNKEKKHRILIDRKEIEQVEYTTRSGTPLWGKKEVLKETKVEVYKKVVRPMMLYRSDSWQRKNNKRKSAGMARLPTWNGQNSEGKRDLRSQDARKNIRGRPRKGWEQQMLEAVERRGIKWNECKKVAQDSKL
ncbi:hypothetical protein ILUMI_14058 [Ignelater luminosus]|uniref:Uncharacterized protein n=1 Tax=Ignelater luminosus TaxID=2038154 RepID=A0A8K0CR67_IGNLU|nr:hypothetical protein ILUMI_14058 [Ignelater luminosus]